MATKTKKYALSYFVKHLLVGWDTSSAITTAVRVYREQGEHPQCDFTGTPLEFANAVYGEWAKRGVQHPGLYPTPLRIAQEMAGYLDLRPGLRVLDPGCGFGNLSHAVKTLEPEAVTLPLELSSFPLGLAQTIDGIGARFGDFLDLDIPVPEFDAVIANPPFGRVYGHAAAEVEFMHRIADLARPGTRCVVILPAMFWTKENKKLEALRERFDVLASQPLGPETFHPLTQVASMLSLVEVR